MVRHGTFRIAGNGISLENIGGNTISGNHIGTDPTGTLPRGNSGDGLTIDVGSNDNTIGGATAGTRNVISANLIGIRIRFAEGNAVLGNRIGTAVTGTGDLGNNLAGVFLDNALRSEIGGTAAGQANTIAFTKATNGFGFGDGVRVGAGSFENRIVSNSIHSNFGLGIDLEGTDGRTANDADVGTNFLQNFPTSPPPGHRIAQEGAGEDKEDTDDHHRGHPQLHPERHLHCPALLQPLRHRRRQYPHRARKGYHRRERRCPLRLEGVPQPGSRGIGRNRYHHRRRRQHLRVLQPPNGGLARGLLRQREGRARRGRW